MSKRRRRHRPRLSHYLEYACLWMLALALRVMPIAWHGAIARLLAVLWYHLLPFRKDVVTANLTTAFPERSAGWRRRTARRCAEHFARMGLEFALWRAAGLAPLRRLVAPEVEGIEHYEAAGGNRAPFVFVTGHLGNWEAFLSYFSAFRGLRMAVVAKPLHNPFVEREVERVRRERGFEVIVTRQDLRQVARVIRRGKGLAFLADQDARRNGLFVPFFGKPASTFRGPALFAYRYDLPLIVGTCCRSKADGRYHMRFFPPIQPDPKADRDAEIERLTRAHVTLLESAIREHPEQYFWFHRRWKTKPRG